MPAPIYSDEDFLAAFQRLLPTGPIWPREADAAQTQTILALVKGYTRNAARAANLLVDAFPVSPVELLDEWEASLGLPDPCAGPGATLLVRQQQVAARFVASGGQSVAYYIAVAAALGYTITTITEFAPFRVGINTVGQPLLGPEWAHVWQVNAPSFSVQRFQVGHDTVGEPLASWGNTVLICELERLSPAHTLLLFSVGGVVSGGGGGGGGDPPTPAMDTAAGLLAYINSIVGTKVISGQFSERGYALGMDPITDVHTATGKWVGILGGDYYWYGSPGPADTNFNAAAIAHHAAGGIITLSLTMPNPTTGGGADDASALNATDLLVSGTATNTAFITSLDEIAVGLAQLRTAGVPVLFRPFHELNGSGWWWWNSAFQSTAQFIDMWRYVHDYLTITKGLDNLLWVYSVNAGYPIAARYPGTGYVDTVGFDYYGDNPGPDLAADYVSLATLGKPMWMTEFGSGDPSSGNLSFDERVLTTALAAMPNLFAWQQWWDANGGGNGWGLSSVTQATAALATSRVLNRDDLPV